MKTYSWHRTAIAVCAAVVLSTFGAPASASAQQEGGSQFEEWQLAELRPLVDTVRAAIRGDLVQTDQPFSLVPDFLKGTDNKTYVPFRLTINRDQIADDAFTMYLFVTEHSDAAPATPPEGGSDDAAIPDATFEDAYFVDVESGTGPIEISRAFSAAGGTYDVYVAIVDSKGPDASDDDRAAATPMMVKQVVDVPDFWNGELQTSSVIVAGSVEALSAPLSPAEQAKNPYTLGTTKIVPRGDTHMAKTDDLSLIMLVYNPQLSSEQKPDLTVEYQFHQIVDGQEEFFNKTNPQQFNAETLPDGFDMSLGHQIVAGQSIPLASFPPGDYRLEISVADNASGQSITRDVMFSVAE